MPQSFPPIADANSRVLILGTMPGEESIRKQQYYANPRNRFWKLFGAVFDVIIPQGYEAKKSLLLKQGIALWDVLKVADREGSLDSAITNETPNDLDGFFNEHSKLVLICFNGQKAAGLYDKYFARRQDLRYVQLPSTSPANASIRWEALLAAWGQINVEALTSNG